MGLAVLLSIGYSHLCAEPAFAEPVLSLTSSDRAWLKSRDNIRLGAEAKRSPFSFTSTSGAAQGICADYIDLIAKRLGISIDLVVFDSRQRLLSQVKTNNLDGIVCVKASSQVSQYLLFNDIRFTPVIADQAHLKIGVRRDWPVLNSTFKKALNDIRLGEQDAIRQKWLRSNRDAEPDKFALHASLATAIVALAIACLWNNRLRQRNRELAISEERFQLAMNATSDGLWDWDISTDQVYYSPVYMRMLGYQPGELPAIEKTWESLLHPTDKARAIATAKKALKESSPAYVT